MFKNKFDLRILATFEGELGLDNVLPKDWKKSVFAKRIQLELEDGESDLLNLYEKARASGDLMEINNWRSACTMWHLFQGARATLDFFLEYRKTAY